MTSIVWKKYYGSQWLPAIGVQEKKETHLLTCMTFFLQEDI